MTSGFDITSLVPLKYKAWVAAIGGLLATFVPIVLGLLELIPAQYAWIAAGVHAVIWVLQWLGVYHAPFAPKGTVLVPETPAVAAAAKPAPAPAPGTYPRPWPKP